MGNSGVASGGSDGLSLLASTRHDPGAGETQTISGAAAFARNEVFGVNLRTTFTVPTSGIVTAKLYLTTRFETATKMGWEIQNNAGGAIANATSWMHRVASTTILERLTTSFKVTGLTPGSTEWRWFCFLDATGNMINVAGASDGQALFEVWG